jgi:hypothetical protein
LKDLIGREISAVAFVRDYVEFHFDGPILRSVAAPYVAVGEAVYRFPKPGSRDALCLVIGATIRSLNLIAGDHFEFTTSNGHRVRIPLDGCGAEALHFTPGLNQPLQVW